MLGYPARTAVTSAWSAAGSTSTALSLLPKMPVKSAIGRRRMRLIAPFPKPIDRCAPRIARDVLHLRQAEALQDIVGNQRVVTGRDLRAGVASRTRRHRLRLLEFVPAARELLMAEPDVRGLAQKLRRRHVDPLKGKVVHFDGVGPQAVSHDQDIGLSGGRGSPFVSAHRRGASRKRHERHSTDEGVKSHQSPVESTNYNWTCRR